MKLFMLLMLLLLSGSTSAQIGVSVGGSMLKGFGISNSSLANVNPSLWGGFHVGVEIPRDDAITFYGKLSHYFKQTSANSSNAYVEAREVTTFPSIINIDAFASVNYTNIEGGTRYYFGNGYDFGWAGYGGTSISMMFNGIRMKYDEYDENLYELPSVFGRKASVINLGVGLTGGVKYSMTGVGTFYFDLGLSYIIFALPSSELAYEGYPLLKPLLFTFNLGYRKDILW